MFKIGSLSDQGWISDPRAILDYILSCYLLSDSGQSLVFKGNITSLPYTYHLHINEPEKMATAMNSDLTTLILRSFVQADVSCKAKQIQGSHYAILVRVTAVTESNERIELAKVMQVSSDNLRKIIQTNNYGDAQNVFNNL